MLHLIGLFNGCLNKNSNPISNGLFPRIAQHPSFFLTTGERVMVLLKENRQPLSRIFIKNPPEQLAIDIFDK